MKKRIFIFFCMLASAILSCSDDDESTDDEIGNWTRTTPFKGRPRGGAVMFTIGTKVFAGLGYDGDEYIGDFYAFDITQGFWESRNNFPGDLRERAVAFSINGKGYVGLGYNRDLDKEELGDFWEYDPATDAWTRVADFAGTARYNAVGFAIGAGGYVGTGYDGDRYNSDFWQYNPSSNSWTEIPGYPGEKIERGAAFVINGKGYVCSGRNNGLYNNDFWEFNPEGMTWTKLAPDDDDSDYDDFTEAVRRHDAVAFSVGDRGYIMGGVAASGAVDKAVYEFNSTTMVWDQRTSFEGAARSSAIAFVLNDRAFVGTGQNGSNTFDDIWEFKPFEEYDENN